MSSAVVYAPVERLVNPPLAAQPWCVRMILSHGVNLPTTVTFTFDANGNLTGDGRRAFEYDYENQLTNVYVAGAWRKSMATQPTTARQAGQE